MQTTTKLIVVLGPTASGKTSLAIDIALKEGAEIFSADSRQFYKELNIGVAKPTKQELGKVKHHFVGHKSIHESYTAGDFEKECLKALISYFEERKTAVLVGGSGLFIKAVLEGLDYFPEVNPEIRTDLNKQLESEGIESLQALLKEKDPISHTEIELDNPRRLIRALEVTLSSDKPFSHYKNAPKQERPFAVEKLGMQWPRNLLYERINKRVDAMMAEGLEEEARNLYPYKALNTLNTVGYAELFEYFDDKCSREFAIEKIKQHSRNYAKRQITWLNKESNVEWINMG